MKPTIPPLPANLLTDAPMHIVMDPAVVEALQGISLSLFQIVLILSFIAGLYYSRRK